MDYITEIEAILICNNFRPNGRKLLAYLCLLLEGLSLEGSAATLEHWKDHSDEEHREHLEELAWMKFVWEVDHEELMDGL